MNDLRTYSNKDLISILRNIAKAGKKRYREENVGHIYKVFDQLRRNQSIESDNLNNSIVAARISAYSYVPIYEDVLRLQLYDLAISILHPCTNKPHTNGQV